MKENKYLILTINDKRHVVVTVRGITLEIYIEIGSVTHSIRIIKGGKGLSLGPRDSLIH